MFSASSYADSIGLTFTSDRNMMPDPELMRACLDEAVTTLDSYLQGKKRSTTARKKSARKPVKRRGNKNLAA